MQRTEFIANRLQEVLLDGKWVANTNYKEQLLATDWQVAVRRIGNLNTIAHLTYHINYYLAGLLQVLRGGPLDIKDQYSFDLPPIESPEDWNKLVNALLDNAVSFVEIVKHMPDHQLDEPFVEARYGSWIRNLECVIEHSYYHLGQISLIRKMILSNTQLYPSV